MEDREIFEQMESLTDGQTDVEFEIVFQMDIVTFLVILDIFTVLTVLVDQTVKILLYVLTVLTFPTISMIIVIV